MSYATGEALILTRVQACTGFSATNTSQANWKVLDSGKSAVYAILKCGGAGEPEWSGLGGGYVVHWKTAVEIWQRYTTDGTTATTLYGNVAAILAILAYPHLASASTVLDANISEIGATEEMWTEGGGVGWLRQTVTVAWDEICTVSFTE